MSSLVNPGRVRVPRQAPSAIERARLALVPTRTVRAPRAPFAVLVALLLGAGVVGLLMFNTHMQQASFYATSLQQRADALAAKRQALEMEVARLRDPQQLAAAGRKLGMVVPPVPAFIDLRTGKISGIPTPATSEDTMRITSLPAGLPEEFNKKPRYIKLPPPPAGNSVQTQADDGPASAGGTPAGGRNNSATAR
ncbi:hypothetical protein EFK50_03245 [Nocardioides marmoriginsengisoli]|uniref:Cell division protein FtsL n=1 Tax=Nocardioides marmoriginsengisoli TaxID=661483 RepID=A0A3N0CNJ7_9ACTN|nr:hypothetical protein [Nocardioides marmoriginsengisoli]RNL65005.1 hypothetical protein EFK50_03245 [Nocardioides marmoriginsengisoli]